MHKVELISATRDEAEASKRLIRLLKATHELKISVDGQGFAESWMSDHTRVFIATDSATGETTGMGLFVFGRRWFDADMTATVVFCMGPGRDGILQFMADTCKILGVNELFFEGDEGDTLPTTPVDMRCYKVT